MTHGMWCAHAKLTTWATRVRVIQCANARKCDVWCVLFTRGEERERESGKDNEKDREVNNEKCKYVTTAICCGPIVFWSNSSRRRRWFRNFLRQVSLHNLENSDPGSFLQQRVSSHCRSFLHLIATLENSTLRYFDQNLQRHVSLHLLLWDSNLADWVLWVSPDDLVHSNSAL